jgi:hypothetical protein
MNENTDKDIDDDILDAIIQELQGGYGDTAEEPLRLSNLSAYSKSELLPLVETTYQVTAEQAEKWVDEALVKQADERVKPWKFNQPDELLALNDGPFKKLRDDNFIDPEKILVYDTTRAPIIQALGFNKLAERYQCGGRLSQWSPEDLEDMKKVKRQCLGETIGSYSLQENGSKRTDLVCSTLCFMPSPNPLVPHTWVVVSANLV